MTTDELMAMRERCERPHYTHFCTGPYCDPVKDAKACLDELARLAAENERLQDILHLDRSGMAKAINEVQAIVRGYDWLREPHVWGLYDYTQHTEETLRKEIGWCLEAIAKKCKETLIECGNMVHAECCGRQKRTLPIEAENESLRHQRDAAVARVKRLLEVLEWSVEAWDEAMIEQCPKHYEEARQELAKGSE